MAGVGRAVGSERVSYLSSRLPRLDDMMHIVRRPGYKYLAAKILTTEATNRNKARKMREREFLNEIVSRDTSNQLPLLRDDFEERGPKGLHICLVMNLLSSNISSFHRSAPSKALPPYIVRNIIAMVLEALVQLHDMNIVHTGKISPIAYSKCLISSHRRQARQHTVQFICHRSRD